MLKVLTQCCSHSHQLDLPDDPPPLPSSSDSDRKDTHKMVFTQLQSIFGHLMEGRLQFHVPKGFWRDFRCVDLCLMQ